MFSRKIHWVFIVVFAVIPLLLFPQIVNGLRISQYKTDHSLPNSISFFYDAKHPIHAYKDEETSAFYVFLPSYASTSNIGVNIMTTKAAFYNEKDYYLFEKGENYIPNVNLDQAYQVESYDILGNVLSTETIYFMKSDKLPTLHISTDSGDMKKLNEDKTYSETGSYELISSSGDVLYSGLLNGISGRGNHTFSFEKKSYQIDLEQAEDIFNMGTSSTWILLCNVYDPSYIRNKLIYDMALNADMEGSPQSEYIDVYFNNEYAGMYLLSEKIEFGENRLEYPDLESQNKSINGSSMNDFPIYLSNDEHLLAYNLPNNPSDITGSYLIEHDYGSKFQEASSGFLTNANEQYVLKNPRHASIEEINYISGLMQEIEDAIISPDGINPSTGKHFTEYIDMDSWANKYIVEEISKNNGGGCTSSYFYKLPDSISTKVFGGPIWDYDKALGNFPASNQSTRDLAFMTLHKYYTSWFYYLYQHEEFVDVVKSNYELLFSDYLECMASDKIDEYLSQIADSARLDRIRFSYTERDFYKHDMSLESMTEYIQNFILARKAFLDEVWIEDKEIVKIHFILNENSGNRTHAIIKGETLQDFPQLSEGSEYFSDWIDVDTGELFTLDTPVYKETTLIPVQAEK